MGADTVTIIAHDKPLFRAGLATLIHRRIGVSRIVEVGDLKEFSSCIAEHKPSLIVMELILNGRLCLEQIQALRSTADPVRILVVSRVSEEVFAERSLRAGANGFVSACESINELERAVLKVHGGGVYISQHVEQRVLQRLTGTTNRSESTDPLALLTERELLVLWRLGLGLTPRMIARELDISVKTVESYRDRIKTKFGVGSSFELMRYAIELQITGQLAPHLKSERPHHLTFGTGFPTDGS